ncbi:unnamed protein product, partial [Choristocarpus tenellus]
ATHQNTLGHHLILPDTADVNAHDPRLACNEGVRVLTGPVIGEVTANSVVILLEVEVDPALGSSTNVTCFVSLVDDNCPRGRTVSVTAICMPSHRPRVFRVGGGVSEILWPGRTYTACFAGVRATDARARIGRFRTPDTCFNASLRVLAVSADRPDVVAPGEPMLWRHLSERV